VERRTKILLAAVVLAGGVVLALQFRKSEIVRSHFSAGSAWRSDFAAAPAGNAAPQIGPQPPGATAFDGHIEAAPGFSSGRANAADQQASGDETGDRSSSKTGATNSPGPLVDLNAPEQTYTIVDGDTLPNLAQRYLGRADRYLELYQYNRDVLSNPEVLPIGAQLRIPSRVAVPSDGNTGAAPFVPATPVTPLVPLPPAPVAASTVAGKSALPASAQRRAPRTYTVQAGDNLVDLARKFYGDGRRYEDLYEANRRVMHNPADLKPGLVLVVP
jgi:nucleoid-associated protein YgaU